MKLTDTLYYFLPVMMGAVGLVLTIAFGSADAEPGASQKKIIPPSADSIFYFPARYTLNAPNQVNDHIQAF
jgi:hypothetical protein